MEHFLPGRWKLVAAAAFVLFDLQWWGMDVLAFWGWDGPQLIARLFANP